MKDTTLDAWFLLNDKNTAARAYRYAEVPDHFTWQKNGGWKKRVRKSVGERVIGRLHTASPSEGERFYLYLLLLHVPGATSYEFLRRVDAHLYETFLEAAQRRGLADEGHEYFLALQDASLTRMPSQMRQLFAHMLVHCEINNGLPL